MNEGWKMKSGRVEAQVKMYDIYKMLYRDEELGPCILKVD
jgi:hypothetical protein